MPSPKIANPSVFAGSGALPASRAAAAARPAASAARPKIFLMVLRTPAGPACSRTTWEPLLGFGEVRLRQPVEKLFPLFPVGFAAGDVRVVVAGIGNDVKRLRRWRALEKLPPLCRRRDLVSLRHEKKLGRVDRGDLRGVVEAASHEEARHIGIMHPGHCED